MDTQQRFKLLQRFLLTCGLLTSIVYITADVITSANYPGYNFRDQAISELSAIGAPTTQLWKTLTVLFSPFLIAFGAGVWRLSKTSRRLRIVSVLLLVWGFSGYLWFLFPMNMRGSIGSTSDTMHLVMAGGTTLLMFALIAFGANTQGKIFRNYSILTIVLMLISGTIVGQQASRVAAQLPTPGMGIFERIAVYSPIIWVSALAYNLLQKNK